MKTKINVEPWMITPADRKLSKWQEFKVDCQYWFFLVGPLFFIGWVVILLNGGQTGFERPYVYQNAARRLRKEKKIQESA